MTIRTDDLDDEQLAATAYVWRQRARAGERNAHRTWERLEQELQRRLGQRLRTTLLLRISLQNSEFGGSFGDWLANTSHCLEILKKNQWSQ